VPGLLQTYETAVAIMATDDVPAEDIERRWMARQQRQRIITKIEYTAFITETVLRTPWGGLEVWRDQLAQLLRSQNIGIGVRVIPERQTKILLMHTWHWMRLRNAPPAVYAELTAGATYIHEADQYTQLLTRLDEVALPKAGSRKLISELMEGVRS
jgi:hypothetical protein